MMSYREMVAQNIATSVELHPLALRVEKAVERGYLFALWQRVFKDTGRARAADDAVARAKDDTLPLPGNWRDRTLASLALFGMRCADGMRDITTRH